MWKLIIHQNKKYDTWEAEQEIIYEAEQMKDLLAIISFLSELYTNTDTWYEIREIKEGEEDGI